MNKLFKYHTIVLPIFLFLSVFILISCGSGEVEPFNDPAGIQNTGKADTGVPGPAVPGQDLTDPDNPVSGNDGNENGSDEPMTPDDNDAEFIFSYGEHIIKMDQDITDVLEMLGDPLGVFEAPSCAFDGIDRIFSFPGIQIHTYPFEDKDLVHTISLRDDSVSTVEGIYLGTAPEKVFNIYGDIFENEFDMFTFTRGQTTLSLLIENNMVVAITYGLIMV